MEEHTLKKTKLKWNSNSKGVPKYRYYDTSQYFVLTVRYRYTGDKYPNNKHTLVLNRFAHKNLLRFFKRPHDGARDHGARGRERRNVWIYMQGPHLYCGTTVMIVWSLWQTDIFSRGGGVL